MKNIPYKTIILYAWVVFSVIFIAWVFYNYITSYLMWNAYTAGQNDTIATLISQAQNKECKPFNVYAWNNKVDLINVACLQQAAPQWNTNTTTPATK